MPIRVHARGPVFDGVARWELREFTKEAAQRVAREGKNDVVSRLNHVLRHQTPYYITRIRAAKETDTRWVVNDGSHTFKYGPWLEGTGSRNSPKTRFPGYRTFAIIREKLKAKAPLIAERLLRDRYLPRIR